VSALMLLSENARTGIITPVQVSREPAAVQRRSYVATRSFGDGAEQPALQGVDCDITMDASVEGTRSMRPHAAGFSHAVAFMSLFAVMVPFLSGCGAATGGAASGSSTSISRTTVVLPTPAASSPAVSGSSPSAVAEPPSSFRSGTVVLGEQDRGSTVGLQSGSTLIVNLPADNVWSTPAASDSSVLRPVSSERHDDGSVTARFTTGRKGHTTVSSTGNPKCSAPCGAASEQWVVTVYVGG
jgi:hypothetical protein